MAATFAVFAAVHAVSGSVCTIFEVVNVNVATGSATWEDGVIYQDVYTTPCTKLRFEYEAEHGSVYEMQSKADYDACNFETESNAFRVSGASTWTEFSITYEHAGQELFFACLYHCYNTMKVTVHVQDTITWNSTLGSDKRDAPLAMAIDNADASVVVVGYTEGDLSLLQSAEESPFPVGEADAFWRKKRALTGRDERALQIGTKRSERFTGVAVNAAGGVIVTGYAYGTMYAGSLGASDIVLAEYDASSGEQKWGLQCCTAGAEFAEDVAVRGNSSVVVVGESSSTDYSDFVRTPHQSSHT